jgi:hypothetical protein
MMLDHVRMKRIDLSERAENCHHYFANIAAGGVAGAGGVIHYIAKMN